MDFKNFEKYISPEIIIEAKALKIIDFTEIQTGKFVATITSDKNYNILINTRNSTENKCSCNSGLEYCPHIVSVLLHLKHNCKNKNILKNITDEELRDFIIKKAFKIKEFKLLFISTFPDNTQDNSKDFYIKQIRSSARYRNGEMQFSHIGEVLKTVNSILNIATDNMIRNNYITTYNICCAVYEELSVCDFEFQHNNLNITIDKMFDILLTLSGNIKNEYFRKEFFDYFFSYIGHGNYQNQISNIVVELTRESEYEKVLEILKTKKQHLQCYNLLFKFNKEYSEFLYEHLDNYQLRNILFEYLMNKKNYNEIITICNKVQKYNDDYEYLLKIAMIHDDEKDIIKYNLILFKQSFDKSIYYEGLRRYVKDWKPFIEKLIWEIPIQYRDFIYIKENMMDRLFDHLYLNLNFDNIIEYEKYLIGSHYEQFIQLYMDEILDYARNNMGRDHYRKIAFHLKRMKNLKAHKEVKQIIDVFNIKYYKRIALFEEINKLF